MVGTSLVGPLPPRPTTLAGQRLKLLTAEWMHWYNTDRLMHRLGRIPSVGYEAIYYASVPRH